MALTIARLIGRRIAREQFAALNAPLRAFVPRDSLEALLKTIF